MKGKLVKRSNGRFDLYSIEDKNQINTIASSFDNPIGKLSLKNCQEIELGYDLDELVSNHSNERWKNSDSPSHFNQSACEKDFKSGFQKALEILGNKKFGEFDMRICFYEGKWGNKFESFEPFIQSLQQTEWDVEIEMRPASLVYKSDEMLPKLDTDGCLILKSL